MCGLIKDDRIYQVLLKYNFDLFRGDKNSTELDDVTGTDRTILSGIHMFYEPKELVGKTVVAITNLSPRAMMGIESCEMLFRMILIFHQNK